MNLQSLQAPRFVRRTRLGPDEYRRNFRQLDQDVIDAVTSREADSVTPLMSKIYLKLINAPAKYWEGEGVLRFEAELRVERQVKAWEALCELLGVASATASKALRWMHEQGIIGYFAGKNGAGIRVFLNRASSSIGMRGGRACKKILAFSPASSGEGRTSSGEAAFNDSYAVSEVLEKDLNPRAPKSGAETGPVGKTSSETVRLPSSIESITHDSEERKNPVSLTISAVPVEEILERLRSELEPCVKEVVARAAAQSASREMERTREWFETKALPKAVRVAQHETYDLLRKYGGVEGRHGRARGGTTVGRDAGDYTTSGPRPLTPDEVREAAEVCVALLETQGKPIEVTLSEISTERGGWLLPGDAPRVREAAWELAHSCEKEGGG